MKSYFWKYFYYHSNGIFVVEIIKIDTMKVFLFLMMMALSVQEASAQQPRATEVLGAAQKANKYFMTKHADPTLPTNVDVSVPAASGHVPCTMKVSWLFMT